MADETTQVEARWRIDAATMRQARERAAAEGRSLRWIVERLLAGYVAGTPVPEVKGSVVGARAGLTPAIGPDRT